MVNSVAQAGESVAKVEEEMVEDDVGKNGDTDFTATEHHVLQILAAPPEVANSIANWSKRRNISIIPEICACVSKYIKSRIFQCGVFFLTRLFATLSGQ